MTTILRKPITEKGAKEEYNVNWKLVSDILRNVCSRLSFGSILKFPILTFDLFPFHLTAGRSVQNEELENMLESGNPAIFTQGVSCHFFSNHVVALTQNHLLYNLNSCGMGKIVSVQTGTRASCCFLQCA